MAFPSATVPVAGSLVLVGAAGYGLQTSTTSGHEPGLYIVLGPGATAGTFLVQLATGGNPMQPMMANAGPAALPQSRILAVWNSD